MVVNAYLPVFQCYGKVNLTLTRHETRKREITK